MEMLGLFHAQHVHKYVLLIHVLVMHFILAILRL